MARFVSDPFEPGGIRGFTRRLRTGQTAAESATGACLERIGALDSRLGAYELVAGERALEQARALDDRLASRTDLGPLMGVPVAIQGPVRGRGHADDGRLESGRDGPGR